MKRKGFTLVELVVVVAIIGMLTAIAGSSYRRANAKSHWGEIPGCLSDTVLRLENYYSNHGKYPESNVWEVINASQECGDHYYGGITIFGDSSTTSSRYIVAFTDSRKSIWSDTLSDTWAAVECTNEIYHVENPIEPTDVDSLPNGYTLPSF